MRLMGSADRLHPSFYNYAIMLNTYTGVVEPDAGLPGMELKEKL